MGAVVRSHLARRIIMFSLRSFVCLVVLAMLANLALAAVTLDRVRRQDETPYWCDPTQAGSAFSLFSGVATWCEENGYQNSHLQLFKPKFVNVNPILSILKLCKILNALKFFPLYKLSSISNKIFNITSYNGFTIKIICM